MSFRLFSAALTGLGHPLCFPSFDWWWLGWVVLVPLHFAINELSPGRSFLMGWLAGVIAFVLTIFWVTTSMHLYGHMPIVLSAFLLLLLAGYLGLFFGFYSYGIAKFQKALSPIGVAIAGSCLWVTLEFLRTHFLSGLPWALLGYSQYGWLHLIQFADLTGVYGVSFLLVLGNCTIFYLMRWAFNQQDKPILRTFPWHAPAITLVLVFIVLTYGTKQLNTEPSSNVGTLTIGVVQANIDQAHKWDQAFRQDTINQYVSLSSVAGEKADLLVWPEAATPFLYEREPFYKNQIKSLVHQIDTPLLFGSPTLRYHQDRRPFLLNSAYLLDGSGETVGRYDKRHLVPFGEYVPLRSLLFFFNKFVEGIGDFESGIGPWTLSLPTQKNDSREKKFGVPICFEVIFPDLVRQFVKEGADFLVTITNDAWFGDSIAPYQHFGMVVLRAVENRVAFARAANTGISGFIAPDGRVLKSTPIFTQQAVTGTIPLRTTVTFYTKHGDVFAWTCVIIATIFLLFAQWRPTR